MPFLPILKPTSSLSFWRKILEGQQRFRSHNSVKLEPKTERGDRLHQKASFTTLESGLRVATLPSFGEFTTIGVAILAGCRNEVHYPPGTSHFVEKLSFSSSKHFPDKALTQDLLENCGAIIDCQSSRDTIIYGSSCRVKNAFDVLRVLADAVLRPNIREEDMDFCKDVIRYENESLARQPECEPLLTDWIHQAAFRSNTVGLAKYCPSESLDAVTSEHILGFLSQYFEPSRIVLAGVGVNQDWLAKAGKALFDSRTTTWSEQSDRVLRPLPPFDESVAQYTGGDVHVERDLSQMALGPTPFPNLAHLVLGFEGVSLSHEDFVPFCVLQSLMGGGGSFSAGGPGKGMYTRLYIDVLNQHHWIYNATAFNHSYEDGGLFCIRASAEPSKLKDLAKIILHEFCRLCDGVWPGELDRAKIQLKSQLFMNLEMRPVQFEDLARQMLAYGEHKTMEDYAEKIDIVQKDDITRIARKMLESRPALVGYGDLREMPAYERIQAML